MHALAAVGLASTSAGRRWPVVVASMLTPSRSRGQCTMAETIDELTIQYEEDGQVLRKQLDKEVLSKGSWTTIMFLYQDLDRKTGEHGVLKGKCAEGPLWQYPGAFTSFDDAGDVKTADTGHWAHEIKQRAEDARKLIQKENVKLDENASSEIPGEVWKSNPLLDSVAGERMSIFHHEITMPTIIVVAGVLIAWLVSLVHSFRRKRGHKDDIRSHVGA